MELASAIIIGYVAPVAMYFSIVVYKGIRNRLCGKPNAR
jgi:hypothetical protein